MSFLPWTKNNRDYQRESRVRVRDKLLNNEGVGYESNNFDDQPRLPQTEEQTTTTTANDNLNLDDEYSNDTAENPYLSNDDESLSSTDSSESVERDPLTMNTFDKISLYENSSQSVFNL
ncbi:unnamed protein product [Didymodactylos carnosus]|uniref:Uncharacterized protein n=1 Tax=Didymodactylos carnosus TaxID=1234261 RepID=A0A815UKW6_9BILA|nr:unnamed protein product [Didymodactylos carnosus]CAF4380274.1 unnamed protein product [Didymodactylos carnosus]